MAGSSRLVQSALGSSSGDRSVGDLVWTSYRKTWLEFYRRVFRAASFCALRFEQISPSAAALFLSSDHSDVDGALDAFFRRGTDKSAALDVAWRRSTEHCAGLLVGVAFTADRVLFVFRIEAAGLCAAGAACGGATDRGCGSSKEACGADCDGVCNGRARADRVDLFRKADCES